MITAGEAMRRVLEQLDPPEDDSDRVEEETNPWRFVRLTEDEE